MSDTVKRVCKSISIDVISAGETDVGAASAKSEFRVDIDEEVQVRVNVCLREDGKLCDEEETIGGEGGRGLR